MRHSVLIITMLTMATPMASAQSFGDLLGTILGEEKSEPKPTVIQPVQNEPTQSVGSTKFADLTQFDAQSGLKEALTIGAQAVGAQLSAEDGYFGDNSIQIPLPGRLKSVQDRLGRFGLSGPLDDLQLRMNRAAEAAAPEAADLVVNAVQSITLDDALSLLQGGDNAATTMLRAKTELGLRDALRPHVKTALTDAGAMSLLRDVSSQYAVSGFMGDLETQLVDHAVDAGLDGLFFYLAKEEQSIRNNPVERSTDLLRKVFGAL